MSRGKNSQSPKMRIQILSIRLKRGEDEQNWKSPGDTPKIPVVANCFASDKWI